MTNEAVVDQFLIKHGMHHEQIEMDYYIKLFINEMSLGLAGNEGSLLMLPTYLQAKQSVKFNKKVIVIDAGGTNFRTALVHFDEFKKPVIESFKKCAMPGFEQEVSKNDFFKIIAQQIADIADQSDAIGFCFSYPAEILSNGDGRVITFSKEIKAPQVVGQLLGEGLRTALKSMGLACNQKVVVLNDTVTTLLTALLHQHRLYDGYIGFILGTGINSAYEEKNSLITKLEMVDWHQSQIINIESGLFNKIAQGDFDRLADENRPSCGKAIFEKMIAGAYLGDFMSQSLLAFITDITLFSEQTCSCVQAIASSLSTKEFSTFHANPYNQSQLLAGALKEASEAELELVYLLVNSLIRRTAKLAAISICATVLKSGKGKSPLRPVCINIDGTTYHQINHLAQWITGYMDGYLQGEHQRYFEIVSMQDASLLGAAIAVL